MQTALSAAAKLAERYRVSLDDVVLADPDTPEEAKLKEDFIESSMLVAKGKHRRPPCNKYVVNILQEFFAVQVIYTEEASRLLLLGRQSDVEFATYVYGYLKHTFTRLWRKAKRARNLRMSERASFFYGLWLSLRKKLRDEQGENRFEAQKELNVGKDQYALALHNEDAAREAFVKNLHPRLRYSRPDYAGNAWDGGAYREGLESGKTIDINKPLK